jgi:hypothetical protein
MGTGKKEAKRRENDGLANVRTKGENFYRCGLTLAVGQA